VPNWGGALSALSHILLVVAGGDLDKPEPAARVTWAGAGGNFKIGTPSAAKVAAGLDRALADSSLQDAAAHVGAQFRSFGDAARAAELLEQLL
jgi:UDP:flavonoid glycosyltransferase YjiC (YdhE family)